MLDDLAALGPFFAVGSHPPAAEPDAPWRPAGELTTPDGPLRDRVASVRAALAARNGRIPAEVEPRVAASAVHLGLVARLVSPALGAAVLHGRADMRPDGLWWQDVAGGPVPLSVAAPPAGHGDQGDWDRVLLDETVAPLTAAITRLVPVSGRVLWGNVASAVNAAAAQVARQRPDLARAAWQAAGRLFASPLLHAEPCPPGPAFRRSSCCLFYRLAPGNPAAVCGDCVLAGRAGCAASRQALSRTTAAYSVPPAASRGVAGVKTNPDLRPALDLSAVVLYGAHGPGTVRGGSQPAKSGESPALSRNGKALLRGTSPVAWPGLSREQMSSLEGRFV